MSKLITFDEYNSEDKKQRRGIIILGNKKSSTKHQLTKKEALELLPLITNIICGR